MKEKNKFMPGKLLGGLIITLIILISGICWQVYHLLYSPDFANSKDACVYIDRETGFDSLCKQLEDAGCTRIKDFMFLAERLEYPDNMRTGRYAVDKGMGMLDLVNRLRRGQQSAIKVTFNNVRTLDELADLLDRQLMIGKDEILAIVLNPDSCLSLGFSAETISAIFLPNTYEVYWNISAYNLVQRMKREYNAFWNPDRRAKAEAIPLSPLDVSILAAIVEEEAALAEEYPIIAGLYINRLHKGMLLQADPTLKYAAGDFSIRRLLNKHKEIPSPYNTYLHPGLPPGPIRIPSIQVVESVLGYMKHRYLFMCAKEDFSGRHNFAVTQAEHSRNAARYHAELNRRRVR
ncbi:MAG: endolytic transglycosylase MltG [Tannerellaceae bacterium]|jgi:UPF0755 protein|nr:endolytic transglycosylase MltG [Tannerellaceae bacterium]